MSTFRSRLYIVLVLLYSLGGTAFAILIAGSIYGIEPINVFEGWLNQETSFLILIGCFVLLTVLCIIIYIASLDPFRADRPWGLVYLNFLPISLFMGSVFIPLNLKNRELTNPLQGLLILGVSFGLPVVVLGIEAGFAALFLALGRAFDDHAWQSPAFFFLKNSLRWRPSVHETARRCGLLLVEMDRNKRARNLLERLGPVEAQEDLEVLRALERVYTAEGQSALALKTLQRQRALQPNSRQLDQRILQQALALDLWHDAISLLESGRIEWDLEKMSLLEQLYVRTDNFPKAIETVRRMAEREPSPFVQSIRLLTDLLEGFPENHDLMIELGQLLQKTNVPEQMEQGAKHLERALLADPKRFDLHRQLAAYYHQSMQYIDALNHYQALVLEKDPIPETYLGFAEVLKAESRSEEARFVYHRMRETCPDDWRGYFREAEMLFADGRLDETEALLDQAQPLVTEATSSNLNMLRRKVAQRRDELRLRSISEDLSSADEDDVEKRLEYIRQLIVLDRADEAVAECDQVLDAYPEMAGQIELTLTNGIAATTQNFRLRDYLADLYFREQRYDESLKMFEAMAGQSLHPHKVLESGCRKLLTRSPDHLASRLALARVYVETQNWASVLDTLAPLMDDPPVEHARAIRMQWIEASHETGKLVQAMDLGLKFLDEYKDDPAFIVTMVRVLEDNGEYQQAFEIFKIGQEAFPENETLQNMSRTVADNKKRNRMEELQELEVQNRLTPAEHYEKAELHRQFNQIHHAISNYQRAADDPDLADLATTKMAICLCDRRLFDMANETLDKIDLTKEKVIAHPELKDMFYWVADVLERETYKPEALKFFKRIFRVDAAFQDVVTRLENLDAR